MLSLSKAWQSSQTLLLAFGLALALWFMVIGSEQTEAQLDVRLDYRGLPEDLVVRDGLLPKTSVRVRGSGELLRGLTGRDLVYSVDLSSMTRGANVLPLTMENFAEFRAFEVVDVSPARLVVEVDALMERVLPLEVDAKEMPTQSGLRLTQLILEPSFATVRGPETIVKPLEKLTVHFDPSQETEDGMKVTNVAINAPEQVELFPPVTTLRYTLSQRNHEVTLTRPVQMDAENHKLYTIQPENVELQVEMPEKFANDEAYLASIRVLARPPDGDNQEIPVLVMLPSGARLMSIQPSVVTVKKKK